MRSGSAPILMPVEYISKMITLFLSSHCVSICPISARVYSEGLFERIEKEPESTCLYKRLFLDYTYGLDRIYTQDEITAAKQSPSFEREYDLKYLGLIGNIFHTKDIEAAIERGRKHLPDSGNSYSQKSVGLDPGFGSSNFCVCINLLFHDSLSTPLKVEVL